MNRKKKKISKKSILMCLALLLCTAVTGCGGSAGSSVSSSGSAESSMESTTKTQKAEEESTGSLESQGQDSKEAEAEAVRIGSLKGPTSMGLLFLQEKDKNSPKQDYEFQMAVSPDELLPLMAKGELDIALIPANAASILYQKTQGGVTVIDINTLGVLYMVTGDDQVKTVENLKGKTIYLTGKGTVPDYVLHYILQENGLSSDEYTLEYKSEPTEVAALLAKQPDAVGMLPQPFATVACAQNEQLMMAIDMNEEWSRIQGENGSRMITGVTVVRNEFLKENEEAVKEFMQQHKESAEAVNMDAQKGGKLAAEAAIIASEPIAAKAIPKCNITYIEGTEMKQALEGFLQVLYQQNPESVGGEMPGDDFYYIP